MEAGSKTTPRFPIRSNLLLSKRFFTFKFSSQVYFLFSHANYLAMLSVCSGYDFAYLLKVLTAQNLPSEESEFFDLLKLYFPNIYDVKYLMKSCKSLKGGLQEVAELLEVCSFVKLLNLCDEVFD